MKTRVASLGHLQELFRAAEALPADSASSGGATASPTARPQHNSLQPPAHPERPLLRHNSLQLQLSGNLVQQHSLGLLERRALGEQTRLRVGLPGRGGSKTFSVSSGLGSEADLAGALAAAHTPRPLRPYGEGVATMLARRCVKAQRMLAELQRPVFSVQDGGERPPLPAAALRFCKVRRGAGAAGRHMAGMACRVRCAWPAVLRAAPPLPACQASATAASPARQPPMHPLPGRRCCDPLQGLAFVKQRKAGALCGWNWGDALVLQRLPDGSWSAPCFMRLRYGSLGLTLGLQNMRTVYVLQARRARGGDGGQCWDGPSPRADSAVHSTGACEVESAGAAGTV